MQKDINYNEEFQDKVAIYLSNDLPSTINWIDKIDKDKLDKGFLNCKYYCIRGSNRDQRSKEEKLELRFFEYIVENISMDTIMELGRKKNFDAIKSLYYWLLSEAKKIDNESNRTKECISDIKDFGIRCKKTSDKKKEDMGKLIEYLEEVEGLDVCNLKKNHISFPSGYEGNASFTQVTRDGITNLATEQELLIERVIRLHCRNLDENEE